MKFLAELLLLLVLFPPVSGFADTVFLKTGKPVTTDKVWEEADKICFYLHGLQVRVAKSEVLRVDKTAPSQAAAMLFRAKKKSSLNQAFKEVQKPTIPDRIKKNRPRTAAAAATAGGGDLLSSNGFGDLHWSTKLSEARGLVQLKTHTGLEGVREYIRRDDFLKLGRAQLRAIVYAFWRNQLYTITVWTQGLPNYLALRDAVFRRFGKGWQKDRTRPRYLWSDAATDRMLEFTAQGQYGMLWMRSRRLDRLVKLCRLTGPGSYLRWMNAKGRHRLSLSRAAPPQSAPSADSR